MSLEISDPEITNPEFEPKAPIPCNSTKVLRENYYMLIRGIIHTHTHTHTHTHIYIIESPKLRRYYP